jgi:hypothetical protein
METANKNSRGSGVFSTSKWLIPTSMYVDLFNAERRKKMKKAKMISVIVIVTVTISLFLVQWIHAKNPGQQEDIPKNPVWQITQEGTAKSVDWIEYAPNPRFAIYDPDTPGDETDDAVIDKETGLVWQKFLGPAMDWISAIEHCYDVTLGGRKGWRVPKMVELSSLVDPNQEYPALPTDHPFSNLQTFYWSSTTNAEDTAHAWYVHFYQGTTNFRNKTSNAYVWCVRGGQ